MDAIDCKAFTQGSVCKTFFFTCYVSPFSILQGIKLNITGEIFFLITANAWHQSNILENKTISQNNMWLISNYLGIVHTMLHAK